MELMKKIITVAKLTLQVCSLTIGVYLGLFTRGMLFVLLWRSVTCYMTNSLWSTELA